MVASKSSNQENKMQRLKASLMMVVADLIIAGFNVSYKVASHDGMHMSVLITYRYLFALICVSPFALFAIRRSKRTKLTWAILFQAFVCAIFGGPMSQNLYAKGLVLTSATFASTFSNLIPPFTFVIAVLLRLEKVEIRKISGKAKVVGTFVAVGGAMLLTFYKGQQLDIWSTHFSLLHDGQHMNGPVAVEARATSTHHIMGSILAMGSSLSYALYLNLQSKLSVNYTCHYSGTFLFCLFAFVQSFAYAVCTERSWSQWKLGWNVRLFCGVFQGVTTAVYIFIVMAAVHLQGPLFVSMFNPLVLVFVAIAGFLVLDEKLYVGTLLGSIIVIMGLYMALWGKSKEIKTSPERKPSSTLKDMNGASNAATTTTTLQDLCLAHTTTSMVKEDGELVVKSPVEAHKEQVTIEEV